MPCRVLLCTTLQRVCISRRINSGRMTFNVLSMGGDGSVRSDHPFPQRRNNAVDEAKNPLELQIDLKRRKSKLSGRESKARMEIDKVYWEGSSKRRSEILVGILNELKLDRLDQPCWESILFHAIDKEDLSVAMEIWRHWKERFSKLSSNQQTLLLERSTGQMPIAVFLLLLRSIGDFHKLDLRPHLQHHVNLDMICDKIYDLEGTSHDQFLLPFSIPDVDDIVKATANHKYLSSTLIEFAIAQSKLLPSQSEPINSPQFTAHLTNIFASKNIDLAMRTYDDIVVNSSTPPNQYTYSRFISGLMSLRRAPEAIKVWNDMLDRQVTPGPECWSALLNYQINDRPDNVTSAKILADVKAIWEYMRQSGHNPSIYAYTQMISLHFRAHRPDEAIQYLEEMLAKGHEPGVVTYNSLISGYLACEKPDIALNILRDADMQGFQIGTDIYNIFLKFYVKHNLTSEIDKLMREMRKKSIEPDSDSYTIVLTGLFKWNRNLSNDDFVSRMANVMTDKSIKISAGFFTTVMSHILNDDSVFEKGGADSDRRLETTLKVLDYMTRVGVKPTDVTFNTLLRGHFLTNNAARAPSFFNYMRYQLKVGPSQTCYITMILGLGRSCLITEMMQYYKILLTSRLNVPRFVFSFLLKQNRLNNKLDLCSEILRDMVNAGITVQHDSYLINELQECKSLGLKIDQSFFASL